MSIAASERPKRWKHGGTLFQKHFLMAIFPLVEFKMAD